MIVTRIATRDDVRALLQARHGRLVPLATWLCFAVQATTGVAWSFRVPAPGDPPPLAIAGIVPGNAGGEVWFAEGPDCNRHMLALSRRFARILEEDARITGRLLRAHVLVGNRQGLRLAGLLGFAAARDDGREVMLERSPWAALSTRSAGRSAPISA